MENQRYALQQQQRPVDCRSKEKKLSSQKKDLWGISVRKGKVKPLTPKLRSFVERASGLSRKKTLEKVPGLRV